MAQKTWVSNDVLTAADMNLYASHEGGAWTSYTVSTTGITAGNGSVVGAYARASRTIHFRLKFSMGSTSAVTAQITFSLPVASEATSMQLDTFMALMYDSSASAAYMGITFAATTSTIGIRMAGGTSTTAGLLVPFTWATSDVIEISGTYESAT